MIEEADFQEIGNAAIDLCAFVDKLRLGEKHREEADKLTHNVLNLIKQTEKIKEEPLTKGNKMKKKLKIQFWKAERVIVMQILEQEGLPERKEYGFIQIKALPWFYGDRIELRGYAHAADWDTSGIKFKTNTDRDEYLQKAVTAITEELFAEGGELKVGDICEVWDMEFEKWQERKLLAILPENYEERFIVDNLYYPNRYVPFSVARPIVKRTEPTVEECGQLVPILGRRNEAEHLPSVALPLYR